MQNWSGFYATIAAASASLLGLLFVAVSINAKESLGPGHEDSRRLAEQGFQNYLAVLVVALIALLPDVSRPTLGLITISVSLGWSVWVLLRLYQSLVDTRRLKSRISSFRRHAVSVLGFGMLIYSALRMSFAPLESSSNFVFGAALIVLVSSATVSSWELLLRISRVKRSD